VLVVLFALATLPVRGQTELELIDGRVLTGTSVRRDGGYYILKLESGEEITFPAELVKTVRLNAEPEEDPGHLSGPAPPPIPGLVRGEAQTLAGSAPPEGPTGMVSGDPQQLAGERVQAPRPSEQLEVFGEPAKFQKGIVDNSWTPSTDWNMDPEEQNNWAPSKWAEDIVDHSWEPTSAWNADDDVMKSSQSTWQKGSFDSSWTPTDGFKK